MLQQKSKLSSLAATDKETVGVMISGQFCASRADSCGSQTLRQTPCRSLAAPIGIGIEGQVHRAPLATTFVVSTQLAELQRIQVRP
jgi:hypothetical protein